MKVFYCTVLYCTLLYCTVLHLVHAALHAVVPGQVRPGLVLAGLLVPARHVAGQRAVVTGGQSVHCNHIIHFMIIFLVNIICIIQNMILE